MTTWYSSEEEEEERSKIVQRRFSKHCIQVKIRVDFETKMKKKKRRDEAEEQQNIQDNYERLYSHRSGNEIQNLLLKHISFYFKFHLPETPEAM